MSVMASGSINIDLKDNVPYKTIIELDKVFEVNGTIPHIELEFDSNWHLDTVIDELEPLTPYVASGRISYWSDDGDARAEFVNGKWEEEWEERYYHSSLPTAILSDTQRVKEILNTILSKIDHHNINISNLLKEACKMTERELNAYDLKRWVE